jgi:hypothetical protein
MIKFDLNESSKDLKKIRNVLNVNELSFEGSYDYHNSNIEEFCFKNKDIYDEHSGLLDYIEVNVITEMCNMLGSSLTENPTFVTIEGVIDLVNCSLELTQFHLSYETITTDSQDFARSHSLTVNNGYRIKTLKNKFADIADALLEDKQLSTKTVKITL